MRLVLRRDRVLLPIWIVVLAGLVVTTASTLSRTYPTSAARHAFAEATRSNPIMTTIYGQMFGDGIGSLTAWRMGMSGAILFALFSVVTTIHHTRREEESGRAELLRSGAVGRNAQIVAVLVVVFAAHLIIAALSVAGLASQGLPAAGSIGLAFGLMGVGWTSCAVAALAGEITQYPRAAIAISAMTLGILILLRLVADGLAIRHPFASALLLFTPVGWVEAIRPFAGEQWWLVPLALSVTLAIVALVVHRSGQRDLGAGWWPARPGPATAAADLVGSFGLAARLNRGPVLGMSIAFATIGVLLGAVAASVGQVASSSPQLASMLDRLHASNPGQAIVSLLSYALAEVIAIYAVKVVLGATDEERSGRAALLVAAGTSRRRWISSHLTFAAVAPVPVLLMLAIGVAAGHSLAGGVASDPPLALIGSAMLKLPAIWVLVGLTVTFVGTLPRGGTVASWAAVGLMVAVEFGWEIGALDASTFSVSPFSHVYPGSAVSAFTVLALAGGAAVLALVGVTRLQRRDFS